MCPGVGRGKGERGVSGCKPEKAVGTYAIRRPWHRSQMASRNRLFMIPPAYIVEDRSSSQTEMGIVEVRARRTEHSATSKRGFSYAIINPQPEPLTVVLVLEIVPRDCGVWSLVSGLWSLVSGLWSLVSGLWSLVSCLWSLVSGLLSLVSWLQDSSLSGLCSGRSRGERDCWTDQACRL